MAVVRAAAPTIQEAKAEGISDAVKYVKHNKRFIHLKNDNQPSNQVRSTFTTVRNPNVVCRHCKKKGHLQKDCFSHKRDKAPIVDANGKVYHNNCINNVSDQPAAAAAAHPAEVAYEDTHIGSVTNLSPYHHLNW
jgi:hypothetical protein